MKLINDQKNKVSYLVNTKGYLVYIGPIDKVTKLWKCLIKNGLVKLNEVVL